MESMHFSPVILHSIGTTCYWIEQFSFVLKDAKLMPDDSELINTPPSMYCSICSIIHNHLLFTFLLEFSLSILVIFLSNIMVLN